MRPLREPDPAACVLSVERARRRQPCWSIATGRFPTRDPIWPVIADLESLNPYMYAANNPLVSIDPRGLFPATDAVWINEIVASEQTPAALRAYIAERTGLSEREVAVLQAFGEEVNPVRYVIGAHVMAPARSPDPWEGPARVVREYERKAYEAFLEGRRIREVRERMEEFERANPDPPLPPPSPEDHDLMTSCTSPGRPRPTLYRRTGIAVF